MLELVNAKVIHSFLYLSLNCHERSVHEEERPRCKTPFDRTESSTNGSQVFPSEGWDAPGNASARFHDRSVDCVLSHSYSPGTHVS